MIDLRNGLTYDEYISNASDEHREVIEKFYNQGVLFYEGTDNIKAIDQKVNVVVFSLLRCKDAATTIPFLMKLSQLNSNISITFFDREGNEELLEKLSGERRVPTILVLNEDGQVLKKYLEFPAVVNKRIENSPSEDRESIVEEVRSGLYNLEIQREIVDLLLAK